MCLYSSPSLLFLWIHDLGSHLRLVPPVVASLFLLDNRSYTDFPPPPVSLRFLSPLDQFLCTCKHSVRLHISKIKFHLLLCALHFCALFYNPVPPKRYLNVFITHSVACVVFFQYTRHFPGCQGYSNEQNRYIFALIEDTYWVSQVVLVVKNPPSNTGNLRDTGFILGSSRFPGARNSNPLQYSCLENPTDREAGGATVLGVTQSQT